MGVFLGTFIIISLCCLFMSLGLLLTGAPFRGGCSSKPPGSPRCEGCPKRHRHRPALTDPEGESP